MREQLYILLGILVTLFQSCSDDASGVYPEESDTELATVNIRVSTRANDGDDTNMDVDEGIKALRIIVLDESWKILENWYQEGLGGTDGKTEEQTVTLKLPRTKVRFLAIANEKSMGRSFDTATLMGNFSDYTTNGLKNIFNRAWDDSTPAFPKTASGFNITDVDNISEEGLPMTGIKGGTDILTGVGDGTGDGTHHDYNNDLYLDKETNAPIDLTDITALDIDIPLVRCVSKIVVNVTNATDNELIIRSVNFGRFFANKVYYYAHNPVHLPYQTSLTGESFHFPNDNACTISVEETKQVLVAYLYPVALRNDVDSYLYNIALESNIPVTSNYKVFLKKTDTNTGSTTDIGRNKLIKIDCTVNVEELTIDNLILIVEQWDDAGEMDDIIFKMIIRIMSVNLFNATRRC